MRDPERLATVSVGLNGRHHICVCMRTDETEKDVKLRVEDSLWGPPAEVIGVYNTPWGKKL